MGRPARISRDQVVAAALALVDERGLDALSMRALAGRLGVDPMAVYRHVRDKEDLLGAMCDAFIAGLDPFDLDGPWLPQVRRLAVQLRDGLVARPALVPVVLSAPVTPASLAVTQRAVELMARRGVSVELATAGFGVVFSYVMGFVLVEASMPAATAATDELVRGAATHLGLPPGAEPPHLDAALALLDDAGDFAFGLDLLLDGIARRAT